MKAVEQRKANGPPDGDCFAACVASILELPIEAVPNFQGDAWWADWIAWLAPRNLAMVDFSAEAQYPAPPGYAILTTDSPRGAWLHSVVAKDGEVVWDPHPQRAMGLGQRRLWTVFVVLDAARVAVHSPVHTGGAGGTRAATQVEKRYPRSRDPDAKAGHVCTTCCIEHVLAVPCCGSCALPQRPGPRPAKEDVNV